jgi:AbrB family looped-hinge helix DNA binding protein
MARRTVKKKYQVVVPIDVRERAGIHMGGPLDATVQRGKIIFDPKTSGNGEIGEGLEDIRKGKTRRPPASAEKMIRALSPATGKTRNVRKRK